MKHTCILPAPFRDHGALMCMHYENTYLSNAQQASNLAVTICFRDIATPTMCTLDAKYIQKYISSLDILLPGYNLHISFIEHVTITIMNPLTPQWHKYEFYWFTFKGPYYPIPKHISDTRPCANWLLNIMSWSNLCPREYVQNYYCAKIWRFLLKWVPEVTPSSEWSLVTF